MLKNFECDYCNGAHPKVLEHLMQTNNTQSLTYGFDEWSVNAKKKISEACEAPDAQVYLLVGGTQTNTTVIDGMLAHCEAVIATEEGHIAVHEAGAIELSGHKVITLPSHEGKMWASDLDEYMDAMLADGSTEHLAQPGMVYISFPTELGTIYTAQELADLQNVCKKYDLKFFVDGARLGYGLMSRQSDVTLPYLAQHCDVFYIGGTKVGALCGEAVVFPRGNAPRHFFSIVKQHGALLAKGRLAGVQFDALFTDNLYLDIAKNAIDRAEQMKDLFKRKGYTFYAESPTNQQFLVIENTKVRELEQKVLFTHWGPADNEHTICRFVTSWATSDEDMEYLESIL